MESIQQDLKAKFAHLVYEWYELIDWKEPLIVGLLSFHVFTWIIVYWTRKRFYFQFGFFVMIIMLLVITEELNKFARNNWQLIATQNYFDLKGIFAAIFYAGPLLFTGFFQLVRKELN
jgi:hypothetical protein